VPGHGAEEGAEPLQQELLRSAGGTGSPQHHLEILHEAAMGHGTPVLHNDRGPNGTFINMRSPERKSTPPPSLSPFPVFFSPPPSPHRASLHAIQDVKASRVRYALGYPLPSPQDYA